MEGILVALLTRLVIKTSIALPLLLASAITQAHFFSESPNSCKAPKKPLKFVTELDEQLFERQVDEYRGCLEKFVTRQNDAMDKHKAGAEKAVLAWKDYAENVLNLKFKETETDTDTKTEPQAEVDTPAEAETVPQRAPETSQ
ncbi:MAG: hypothetical protein V7739_15680 [Motiliproteus sp.]